MILQGIQIPESGWSAAQWKSYHQTLKSEFGKDNANIIWTTDWDKLGSGWDALDEDFVRYLNRNGIDIQNVIQETITDIGDVKDMTMKMLLWGIPIVSVMILIPVGMFLFRTGKTLTVKEAVGAAGALRGGGKQLRA